MFSLQVTLNLSFKKKKNKNEVRSSDFIGEAFSLIKTLEGVRRPATIKNYTTAIRSFSQFLKGRRKPPLSHELLMKYEQWLWSNGITRNTSSCYLRSLRAIYEMLYGNAKDIFRGLYLGNEKTIKRALPTISVRRLMQADSIIPPKYQLYYDVFLFSVLAFGMPFVDLAHLSKENICGNTIIYKRKKTNQVINVPITTEMSKIMERYSHKSSDNLIFPLLPCKDCHYGMYQNILSKYNRKLKKLSEEVNIPFRLTSYVARHTWATLANVSGINVQHISQAMGHTNLRTTQIYLAQLSTQDLRRDSMTIVNMLEETEV